MIRPKLLPYLGIRTLAFTPLLLFVLLSVLRLPQWVSISIYIIVTLALILLIITRKSEAYMLGLMVTTITASSILIFVVVNRSGASRDFWTFYFFGYVQFLLCILANICYEIGIWRRRVKSPDAKITLNKYLKVAAVLFCLCLGPLVLALGHDFYNGSDTFLSILIIIGTILVSNPIILLMIGYFIFRKKTNITHKAFIIYSSIYGLIIPFLPWIYFMFLAMAGVVSFGV